MRESKFQKEKTQYLQDNVLDKILGPGKAVVIVDVEMGLEGKAMTMDMGKNKTDKKNNPGDPGEPPARGAAARELVPRRADAEVRAFQAEEDHGGAMQKSGGEMVSKQMEVHTTIKKALDHRSLRQKCHERQIARSETGDRGVDEK